MDLNELTLEKLEKMQGDLMMISISMHELGRDEIWFYDNHLREAKLSRILGIKEPDSETYVWKIDNIDKKYKEVNDEILCKNLIKWCNENV